jgi:tellurite resistance protein
MSAPDEGLLRRVAQRLGQPPGYAGQGESRSVLVLAAGAYGSSHNQESEDTTRPTGFDPQAAALFEAVVESAYLVANADGVFDAEEVAAFRNVIVTACDGKVSEAQADGLIADLRDQFAEDGIEKRIEMVARVITRPDHAKEVLRIAGLLAAISGGVSTEERDALSRLASRLGVGDAEVGAALDEVSRVLQA